MMKPENRAVFLDRDGVLIEDVNYLSNLADLQIYEDVPEGLISLKKEGFILIVITNQSGVARGFFSESFVLKTFDFLNMMLGKSGITLDGMYYCPHHQDGNKPYNIECNCRKPAPGMIEKASREYGIDCARSYMIGDKKCDIELSINAGTSGILLKTGKGEAETESVSRLYPRVPIFNSFSEAIDHILEKDRNR